MSLRINPAIARLRCSKSGQEVPTEGFTRPLGLCSCCPAPGKPLVVEYDSAQVQAAHKASGKGLFRFGAMLPVLDVPAEYAGDVGGTPVLPHHRLSELLGVEVFLKNEATNPSGSFKDRGLAMGIAFGAACGAQRFCLPTQGNAGVAACLFSARLGLPPALVYMPDGYQGSIYHKACAFFGGEVRFFGPNIAAAGRQMREDVKAQLASGAFVDISTFFEPGRLEGKKTMGLEIAEAFAGTALPDAIFYPTGGGTGLVGIWKALCELEAWGLADAAHTRKPAMVSVQSTNCAPVVEAFQAAAEEVTPVVSKGTCADGLDVPGAIMGHAMLKAVRDSSGFAAAVEEAEIQKAFEDFGRLGITAGYESAATLAALRQAQESGRIAKGSRVLLLLTGSHLIPLSKA